MRPASGRDSPAMALTSVVLPEPERPNSAVTPPSAPKRASRVKAPAGARRRPRARHSGPMPACDEAGQRLGREQRERRRRRPRSASGAARPRRRPAPGSACRWRGRVCVSPGMLDTKVIVAPNSPMRLARSTGSAPAMIPGRISGSVTAGTPRPARPERAGRGLEPAVDRLDGEADRPHQQREAHHRRRRAPRRSSGTRTRCRDARPGTRRSARAARSRSAADSRSPPAAGRAADARARRAAERPQNRPRAST